MKVPGKVLFHVALTVFAAPTVATLPAQTSLQPALRPPLPGQIVADVAPLYSAPAATAEAVLQTMASRAAIIFVGTVTAVHKPSDSALRDSAAASIVEVDFTVENSIRGVPAGPTYAMREWAGMWRDNPRFVAGQRLLMLLHAPGPSGLSSPIDGLDGAIPVRGGAALSASGTPLPGSLADQTSQVTGSSAATATVDMRWLQAKTLRSQTFADTPVASPGVTITGALTATAQTNAVTDQPSASAETTGSAGQSSANVGLPQILSLLASWQSSAQMSAQEPRSASN